MSTKYANSNAVRRIRSIGGLLVLIAAISFSGSVYGQTEIATYSGEITESTLAFAALAPPMAAAGGPLIVDSAELAAGSIGVDDIISIDVNVGEFCFSTQGIVDDCPMGGTLIPIQSIDAAAITGNGGALQGSFTITALDPTFMVTIAILFDLDDGSFFADGGVLGTVSGTGMLQAPECMTCVDTDNDTVDDSMDNCTLVPNTDQRDTNGDGYGNACDPDLNNDNIVNFADVSMWVPFFNTATSGDADFNGDGSANFADYVLYTSYFLQPPGPSEIAPVIDDIAPVIVIEGLPGTFSTLDPITVTFQFSEPVIDFDVSDVQVSNGSVSVFVAVDADTYSADITPDGAGDLTINIDAGAAQDAAGNGNEMASASSAFDPPTITSIYFEDFEGFSGSTLTNFSNPSDPVIWRRFTNVFDDGVFQFSYSGIASAVGPQMSALVFDQGGVDQGAQQLSVYSDYECCFGPPIAGHQGGGLGTVEVNILREFDSLLTSADAGTILRFTVQAKRGGIGGNSTAFAFIKVLDPSNGFSTTAIDQVELTSASTDWQTYTMEITAGDWDGQLLQIGFQNTSGNFDDSGMFYDNVELSTIEI